LVVPRKSGRLGGVAVSVVEYVNRNIINDSKRLIQRTQLNKVTKNSAYKAKGQL